MKLVFILLALSGCTQRGFNRASLALSHVTIACDYNQTRNGLSHGIQETNPILGDHPTVTKLTAYNAGAILVTTGAYETTGHLFGEKWKWIVPLSVSMLQLWVISSNAVVVDKPFCGLY